MHGSYRVTLSSGRRLSIGGRQERYAGSIPAASTFPANCVFGMGHLVVAFLGSLLGKRLCQDGGVELRIPGRGANVCMAEKQLRQAQVVLGALELGCRCVPATVHVHPALRAFRD
jgi:hypothetical protein